MLLIWRGRGLLAVVAFVLPFATCAGLLDVNPGLACVLGFATLFGCGWACWHYGRKWNQPEQMSWADFEVVEDEAESGSRDLKRGDQFETSTRHSLYGLPLEDWGVLYLVIGGFVAVLSVVGVLVALIVKLFR